MRLTSRLLSPGAKAASLLKLDLPSLLSSEKISHLKAILHQMRTLPNHPPNNTATLVTPLTPLPTSPTSVRLVCVRHGQAHHNTFMDNYRGTFDAPEEDPDCPVDPKLTDLGESQARSLIPTTTSMGDASLLPNFIYTSPLRRAMQTGILAFPSLTFPFHCTHLLAEESNGLACDYVQPSSSLLPDFGDKVDYREYDKAVDIQSEHNTPIRTLAESKAKLCERTDEFLSLVRSNVASNPERRIIGVCSHSQWLQAFFVKTLNIREQEEAIKWFGTGEMRVVDVELIPPP